MNHIEDLFFEADSLLSDDKVIESKNLLLEILADSPDYGKAHNHLGWIYHYKLVDFNKAEKHYKLALKYSKGYYASFSNYSYFLIDRNDYDEMLKFGSEALKVKEADIGLIYNQMAKSYELKFQLMNVYNFYKKAKMSCTAANYIEEINSSMHRVREKMSFFEKLTIIFK
ncbi:hypothetical protein [Winogradskyella immobilis]|uniref:Tetratricopeptide repeat protein n=1 Tax=Winogradskyella immobilis TaxID=2816852 RepID=A0ABS8ENL3_9FLAO|nr:hypothetical protein [Winogradskyella immobilis]MCC1484804.1 hypothetical protein [Winogradskyella immobilis]MCG0016896.1 hypothetical protein [Winogradskyella immobilis]